MPAIVDDIRYAASILHESDPGGTLPKTLLSHSSTVYDLLEVCEAQKTLLLKIRAELELRDWSTRLARLVNEIDDLLEEAE